MHTTLQRLLLLLVLSLGAGLASADGERGWFGMSTNVKSEGMFWNPTLIAITIEGVAAGSPAAAQGLSKGDQVLDLEGQPIAGRKGSDVQAILQGKAPGDKLVLRLQRANGEIYIATLVAGKRP